MQLLLCPSELSTQLTPLRVAGYLQTAYFGDELRLLPAVEQPGADTQLLSGGLGAAALRGQAQGLGFKGIVVFAPSIRRRLALFRSQGSRIIRPASIRPD